MNLVVMAAGMGSRFGGLKQLTPVGPSGEFLIDYSVYDAIQAGVNKVIFVIRKEHLDLFRETIGKRIEQIISVEYAFQELNDLPISVENINREKPWGTGQAVLASRHYVDSPFMVINADDFYGRDAFIKLGSFLKENTDESVYAMVVYLLKNTLSDYGTVSRGICDVQDGYLKRVVEKTKLGYVDGKLVNAIDDHYEEIDEDSKVSMNLFGFTPKVFTDAMEYFKEFLMDKNNLEKQEFYIPSVVQRSIDDGKASVKVMETDSRYLGMTYKDDLAVLKQNIEKLVQNGVYPTNLWEALEHEKK